MLVGVNIGLIPFFFFVCGSVSTRVALLISCSRSRIGPQVQRHPGCEPAGQDRVLSSEVPSCFLAVTPAMLLSGM